MQSRASKHEELLITQSIHLTSLAHLLLKRAKAAGETIEALCNGCSLGHVPLLSVTARSNYIPITSRYVHQCASQLSTELFADAINNLSPSQWW